MREKLEYAKKIFIFAAPILLFVFLGAWFVFNRAEPPSIEKPINEILKINESEKKLALAKAEKAEAEAEKIKLSSERDKAELKGQIAGLKARLSQAKPLPVVPEGPEPSNDSLPTPSEALSIALETIGKQDELIKMLETDLEKAVNQRNLYKLSNEQLKIALQVSERNEAVLRIAKDAQIAAIKSSRWQGRKEGFIGGVLLDLGVRLVSKM